MKYSHKAELAIKAMNHLLKLGWPNKNLARTKAGEFHRIQDAFLQETGRQMNANDLDHKSWMNP